MKKILILLLVIPSLISCNKEKFQPVFDSQGNEIIDKLNGIPVYYNNGDNARNKASDGYNYGLKWQCVEFTKRYYFDYLHHKMPNSYGHAKSFYNKGLKDGQINKERNLIQYSNKSMFKPKVNDIVVLDGHAFNKYGHIAIISKVENNQVEIVQQNVGRKTRVTYKLIENNGLWTIQKRLILGRLRLK